MSRAPRSRKTASLSESVHHQLNMYALAAGAAGVGVLALVQPGEAKIVYTPTHIVMTYRHRYLIDLNHDGVADFVLTHRTFCSSTCVHFFGASGATHGNSVIGYRTGKGVWDFASALKRGSRIGPEGRFATFGVGLAFSTTNNVFGKWVNVTHRYLGLRFKIKGEVHYGWARFDVKVANHLITPTMTGTAYETIPGKAIIAGATKGPDDGEPTASFNARTPELATLGALALGSPGLSIWRREEPAARPQQSN